MTRPSLRRRKRSRQPDRTRPGRARHRYLPQRRGPAARPRAAARSRRVTAPAEVSARRGVSSDQNWVASSPSTRRARVRAASEVRKIFFVNRGNSFRTRPYDTKNIRITTASLAARAPHAARQRWRRAHSGPCEQPATDPSPRLSAPTPVLDEQDRARMNENTRNGRSRRGETTLLPLPRRPFTARKGNPAASASRGRRIEGPRPREPMRRRSQASLRSSPHSRAPATACSRPPSGDEKLAGLFSIFCPQTIR